MNHCGSNLRRGDTKITQKCRWKSLENVENAWPPHYEIQRKLLIFWSSILWCIRPTSSCFWASINTSFVQCLYKGIHFLSWFCNKNNNVIHNTHAGKISIIFTPSHHHGNHHIDTSKCIIMNCTFHTICVGKQWLVKLLLITNWRVRTINNIVSFTGWQQYK